MYLTARVLSETSLQPMNSPALQLSTACSSPGAGGGGGGDGSASLNVDHWHVC